MFKHIRLPTDGSPSSEVAIQKGVRFAKSINARLTGFYVMPEFHVFSYRTEMLEDTKEQFAKDSRAHADRFLAAIEKAAKTVGLACDTGLVTSDHPYEAIIKAAEERAAISL